MMDVKVKFNTHFIETTRRMKYADKHMEEFLKAHAMNYAIRLIEIFQDGVKKNNFGLIELQEATVKAKQNMSFLKGRGKGKAKAEIPYKKPKVPLYGAGLDIDKKTYINMLRIFTKKDNYTVAPSWGKHHKADLKLRDLWDIHEKGRTIITKTGTAIRIPPRPAFFLAHRRFLAEKRQQNPSAKFKLELNKFIETGKSEWFRELAEKAKKGNRYKD
jgi:hypothetical protein